MSCENVWYYTITSFWFMTREADFSTNPATTDRYQELLLHAAEAYGIKLSELEGGDNSDCSYDYVNVEFPSQPPIIP